MQSVQSSQVEIGLSSITDILSNISFGTNTGNDFLRLISGKLNSIYDAVELPVMKILTYSSKTYDVNKDILLSNELINYQLDDICELLTKLKENKNKPYLENNSQSNNYDFNKDILLSNELINYQLDDICELLTKLKENKNKPYLENNSQSNIPIVKDDYLKIISEKSTKILDVLMKKSTTSKDESKDKKTPLTISSIFTTIKDFALSLITIKKELTDKLIQKINKFADSYLKFINIPKEKSEAFEKGITNFSDVIGKLGKTITKPAYALLALTGAFTLLMFLTINPMFILAIGAIGLMLNMLTKFSDDKSIKNNNIDKLGYSILALTVAMIAMQFVSWESGGKMILFISALNLALRGFTMISGTTTKADSVKNNPFIMFALGISTFVLTMMLMPFVKWESGIKLILFIGGLNLALRGFMGPKGMKSSDLKSNPMVGFSLGIGLLTLSLLSFDKIPLTSIFKMLLFVGVLGLTMKLFNFHRMGPANSMVIFALGLGLFILAILAFDELPYEAMFKTIMFIGALGLTMKLFNFNRMGPANSMISFSFGFAIMVLAMYAMNELPYEAMFKTLLFLGGLGLVMKLFNGISGLSFLLLSIGIIAISGALFIFKKIDWTISDALIFGATIAILAGVVALVGIPVISTAIGLGTIAITAMSIGLIITGLSLSAISNLPINHTNLLNFAISSGLLAVTFAAITPFAILGAVGAIAFLPIAASSLIAAVALTLISKIENFDVSKFSLAVLNLTDTYFNLGWNVVGAAFAAVAFLPIASVSILTAIALRLISGLVINNTNLLNYGMGIKTLVNGINDLGGWDLARTAGKSLLLVPVFGSALAGALVLRVISALDIDNNKVLGFGNLIISFTDTIATALSQNESKLSSAMPGINALAKLMSISGSLAKTIQLMANMQFYEYGVENGKLVLKGVRSLNANDFKRVGENLGTMLKCLIEPLTILGSNSNSFVIGGKVITNPFKSSTALKGIEMLAAVGNAFKPLAESVKTYSSLPMVSNPELLDMFRNSLIVITQTYMWIFQKLSTLNPTLIISSISLITKFNENFKNIDTKKIESLNTIFEKFVNNLSDDVKWLKIHNNLKLLGKQFQDVAKSINSIDIEKATLFERNVRNLVDKNNGENLRHAVESLAELLNMIKEQQEVIINTPTTPNPLIPNPLGNLFDTKVPTNNNDKKTPTKQNNNDALLINALNGITSQLSGIAGKLSDTLKVRVTGGPINTVGG